MKTVSVWVVWQYDHKLNTDLYDICLTREAAEEVAEFANKYYPTSEFVVAEAIVHD